LLAAAERTIAEGNCFLTKGVIPELKSDSSWYYWNVDFSMREGDRRWVELLYVPIDLHRFPDVGSRQARLSAFRDYQRTEAAYLWNSKPYEERQKLVAQASSARQEITVVSEQLAAAKNPVDKEKLGIRLHDLHAMVSLVPKKYDPVTLESIL